MSLCRKFYEIVVGQAISIVRFQKPEDAPLESRSITRLRTISQQSAHLSLVERLLYAFIAKTDIAKTDIAKGDIAKGELANNQGASPALSNSGLANCLKPAAPPSVSGSTKGKGSGIVCGVDSVAAIAHEKEKDNAAKRARVTSNRLTALKTYLEQGAN